VASRLRPASLAALVLAGMLGGCGAATPPRAGVVTTKWALYHVSRDGRTLFVSYSYGCFDTPLRVTTTETPSAVSIAVVLSHPRTNALCTLLAHFRLSHVRLHAALGRRSLRHPPVGVREPASWPVSCARVARARRDAAAGDPVARRVLAHPAPEVRTAERICAT
jgi:hypothetical protein